MQDKISVIERDLDIMELFVSQTADDSSEEREVLLTKEVRDLKEDCRIKHLEVSILSTKMESLELTISQNNSVDCSRCISETQSCQHELAKAEQLRRSYQEGRKITAIENVKSELLTCATTAQVNEEALAKRKVILYNAFKEVEDFKCAVQRAERETSNISSQMRHLLHSHDEDMRVLSKRFQGFIAAANQHYCDVCQQTEDAEELQQQCKCLQIRLAHLNEVIESEHHTVNGAKQSVGCAKQSLADAKATLYNLQQKCYLLNMQIQTAANRNFVEKAESISLEADALRDQLAVLVHRNEEIKSQVCVFSLFATILPFTVCLLIFHLYPLSQLHRPGDSAVFGVKYHALQEVTSQLQQILDGSFPELQRSLQESIHGQEGLFKQCNDLKHELEEMGKERSNLEQAIQVFL